MRLPTSKIPHPIKLGISKVYKVISKLGMGLEAGERATTLFVKSLNCFSVGRIIFFGYIVVGGPFGDACSG